MNLGVLAADPAIVPILEAINSHSDPELSAKVTLAWTDNENLADELAHLCPQARRPRHWDELLLESGLDAVLLAGTTDDLLAAARQLLRRDVPLLVATDVDAGPSSLFVLTPLWQDSPHAVVPLFPNEGHGFGDSPEAPWRVEFTRFGPVVSPARIDRLFFQDLGWLLESPGEPLSVTMQTSGFDPERPVSASITLSGGPTEIHWSCQQTDGPQRWEQTERFRQSPDRITSSESPAPTSDIQRSASIRGQLARFEQRRRQGLPQKSWSDVIRLGEIGAAAKRSLQRKRTVDVHFEEASERSQFKSQMAALGCGALLWALFGTILLLTVTSIFDPRDREWRVSAAAGFVLPEEVFLPPDERLNAAGRERVREVAANWSETSPVLVVEADVSNPEADAARRRQVLAALRDQGVDVPESRVVSHRRTGVWYERLVWVGWGLVFLPLAICLLLQLLIVAARPAEPR